LCIFWFFSTSFLICDLVVFWHAMYVYGIIWMFWEVQTTSPVPACYADSRSLVCLDCACKGPDFALVEITKTLSHLNPCWYLVSPSLPSQELGTVFLLTILISNICVFCLVTNLLQHFPTISPQHQHTTTHLLFGFNTLKKQGHTDYL
jgi:hypothetical protein